MARPRNTSDKQTPGAPENDDNAIEDAVVIGETDTPDRADRDPVAEETAPEASSEIGAAEDVRRDDGEPTQPGDTAEDSEQRNANEAPLRPEPEAPTEAAAEEQRPAAPPPPRARSGGSLFLALVFGGVIAALAGLAVSRFVFPDGWPGQGDIQAVLADLRSEAETQTARIAELESALASLRDEVAAVPDATGAVADLESQLGGQVAEAAEAASQASERLGALDGQLEELSARVEELAMRPMPGGLDPASLDTELAQFRSELSAAVDAARADIVSAQEEADAIAARAVEEAAAQEAAAAAAAEATRQAAEAAASAAAREAARSRILAAIESGEPFAEDLAALEGVEIPETLAGPADDGVPTLSSLADSFPEAARAALDASIRTNAGEDPVDRLGAFLRVQTGARSLEPREGDDPDAVLSRAEAAVRSGELEAALAELAALPEAGQAEMAGWIESARTRLAALEAAQGLSQE